MLGKAMPGFRDRFGVNLPQFSINGGRGNFRGPLNPFSGRISGRRPFDRGLYRPIFHERLHWEPRVKRSGGAEYTNVAMSAADSESTHSSTVNMRLQLLSSYTACVRG